MNNAKHTQGPWAVDHAFGVGPISDSDDQSYGMVLAVADTYGDNRVADSRLIAAAPELLEACKSFIAAKNLNESVAAHNMARAAIDKATGVASRASQETKGEQP